MFDFSFDNLFNLNFSWDSFFDYIFNNDWFFYFDINVLIDWDFNRNLHFFLDYFFHINFSFNLSHSTFLNNSSLRNLNDFWNINSDFFFYNDIFIEWLFNNLILMDIVNNSVKNHSSFSPINLNVLLIYINNLFIESMAFSNSLIRSLYKSLNWLINIDFIFYWNLYDFFYFNFYDLFNGNLYYFFYWPFYYNFMNSFFFVVSLNWNINVDVHWDVYISIIRFRNLFYNLDIFLFFDFFNFLLPTSLRSSWCLSSHSFFEFIF